MNPFQRALIEKVGVDNGFEHTLVADEHNVTLASARHPTRSTISVPDAGFGVRFRRVAAGVTAWLPPSYPGSG